MLMNCGEIQGKRAALHLPDGKTRPQEGTVREPSLQTLSGQLESVLQQLSLLATAQKKMDNTIGDVRHDIKALSGLLCHRVGTEDAANKTVPNRVAKPPSRCEPADGMSHGPCHAAVSTDKRLQSATLVSANAGSSPHEAARRARADLAPTLSPHDGRQLSHLSHPEQSNSGSVADGGGSAVVPGGGSDVVPGSSQSRPTSRPVCAMDVEKVGATKSEPICKSESLAASASLPYTRLLRRILRSPVFEWGVVLLIFLNTAWMGYQVEWLADNRVADGPSVFMSVQHCFTILFLIEVLLRIGGSGVTFFTSEDDAGWNIFDLSITASSVVEMIFLSLSIDSLKNMSFLRILRVLRIVRIVRIIRVFRFFRELRMMVHSVLNCMRSLLWAICILTAINYIAAIFFTQVATDYRFTGEPEAGLALELERYFAHLYLAMYYLFLCVSGGISWGEVAAPLMELDWSYGVVMCLLIAFTVFAVLNIVTAVFVENAMETAHLDQDNVLQTLLAKDNNAVSKLRKIFAATDADGSGMVDYEEFLRVCDDKFAQAQFHQLGLEVPDLKKLFRCLDTDDSGAVSGEEFVEGCLRLRGGARNVDMAALMQENKRVMKKWNVFMNFVKEELRRLSEFEHIMLGMKPDSLLPGTDTTRSPEPQQRISQARAEMPFSPSARSEVS